jgi:hypothetical protein
MHNFECSKTTRSRQCLTRHKQENDAQPRSEQEALGIWAGRQTVPPMRGADPDAEDRSGRAAHLLVPALPAGGGIRSMKPALPLVILAATAGQVATPISKEIVKTVRALLPTE